MTLEERIQRLEIQMANLQASFIQSQKNQVPITAKTDSTASQVQTITPYTESKMAYIGDTFTEFDLTKQGNISAWIEIDGVQTPCVFVAEDDKIKVEFEALEKVATVSISIQ